MSNYTVWHGCYRDSWNGILVPEAFAHPAKVAPGLAYRIYRHLLDCGYIAPGDSVVDPFGGIGGFGYHAMLHGLHFTGVELEPRFVALAAQNIEKWRRDLAMLNGTLGTARLLQGDSRRLAEVVAGAAAVVSSPPFGEGETRNRTEYAPGFVADMMSRAYTQDRQGETEGNLATLRADESGFTAVVSSPPYDSNTVHGASGIDETKYADKSKSRPEWSPNNNHKVMENYGDTPGQLGAMPSGSFDSAVSSPPYSDMIDGWVEGAGARHDHKHHNPDTAERLSSDTGYGDTPGNIGHMSGAGFEAAVSSPPYEASLTADREAFTPYTGLGHYGYSPGVAERRKQTYGSDPANIGNDTGDTFWSAARVIVEQTYAVLKPGGYAAWVTKDFVRKGERVPFSDQWEHLCAAVGFEPVERIYAMLVEEHGEQLDIFGGATVKRKERKSFFRRLAEKKGSPRIDWEDVIIMRKPEAAQ